MSSSSENNKDAMISFVCKRTVVSTKPVVPNKFFELSVLDRLMENNNLRMVWYYPPIRAIGEKIEAGETTRKLRESLSEALNHFPAMTGRLKRDKDEDDENKKYGWTKVKCNDAGVRVVEARAKGSVEDWLKCVDRDKELLLVYWEEMYHKPCFWSTFYVQLTEFEEGGFAIGLSCIHLLSDPTSVTVFLNSWAQMTFFGKMLASYLHPLPLRKPHINHNTNHIPYDALIDHYKSTILKSLSLLFPISDTPKSYTTVSFLFTDDKVRELVAKAKIVCEPNKEKDSWAFEALCGLFWVCVSKAKGVKNELVDMSVCLDARNVLGLDKRFFGNCMVYNRVQAEGIGESDVSEATRRIASVVAKMDGEGVMDLIEWLKSIDNEDQSRQPPLMNGCDLVFTEAVGPAVDPYLAVFGDGVRPIHVSCYVEPVVGLGQVIVLPGPPKEGSLSRVVMVTLPRDDLAKLCNDDLLLSFSPTLLMG